MKLENKVAIVTGAGGGIGEATALLFAREGARVCCNSLSESARQVAERIRQSGGEASFYQGDVSTAEAAERIVAFTVECYGRLDIVFNNAIVIPGGG
jgi:NAD(P)-dependent dehydrogenase (short-subunit alcohol dehydrogenase family)